MGVVDGSGARSWVVLSAGTGFGGSDSSGASSGGPRLTWLSRRESELAVSSGTGLGESDGAIARCVVQEWERVTAHW